MGEIVNLNRIRKGRARAESAAAARVNRAAHGRTRADRSAEETERERARRLLDGAKRDSEKDD